MKKNRVEFQRSRYLSRLFGTSLSLCFVGERSEISNFLREDVDAMEAWKDSSYINQKEREAERE